MGYAYNLVVYGPAAVIAVFGLYLAFSRENAPAQIMSFMMPAGLAALDLMSATMLVTTPNIELVDVLLVQSIVFGSLSGVFLLLVLGMWLWEKISRMNRGSTPA